MKINHKQQAKNINKILSSIRDKKLKRHFLQFLLLRGCYIEWLNNLPVIPFSFSNAKECINEAFTWSSTPQGSEYWSQNDRLWRNEYTLFQYQSRK